MKKYILILSVLLLSATLYAQHSTEIKTDSTWIYVGMDAKKTPFYVKSSIESKDEISGGYKVWVKELMATFNAKAKIYKNVKLLVLYSFDCERKQMAIQQWILYNSKGDIITSSEPYESGSPENVIPDSMGESLLKKVCELFNN